MGTRELKKTHTPRTKRPRRRNTINKAGRSSVAGLVVSDHTSSAAGLLDRVTFSINVPAKGDFERYIGEARRCVGAFRLREIRPRMFKVYPLYLRVVGGGPDLLHGQPERDRPIPGHFSSPDAAEVAAVAWATAFNEAAAG